MKAVFSFLFFLFTISTFSQSTEYIVGLIPQELKENANAVVRLNELNLNIDSQRSMTIKSKKVTTILNDLGLRNLDLSEYYDKNRKIIKIQATAYDAFGKEIKAFKRKDFRDTSVGDGFSVFNDNRALYLDYTPISYPFTMVFETTVQTSNTAFIPTWSPLEGYFISTEKTILNVNCSADLGFKTKEVNLSSKYNIQKTEQENKYAYQGTNIQAIKGEDNSLEFEEIAPIVYMKVEKFNLEGVDGEVKTWEEFGKWYYDNLLKDTNELPLETITKIKQLVGTEKNPLEIAKIVYKYVQDKTRYVSIQVGIGGFKPMLAQEVDKLGYGDCKALSNYTRVLLDQVGVPSYYTVVNAGSANKKGIQEDFVSVQGNHVILAIPNNNELVWLECTSQTNPFGFQGTFTDDRNVLLIKPVAGQIVKTKAFLEKNNSQVTTGNYTISAEGNLVGALTIITKGSQYDNTYGNEKFSSDEKETHYKNYFDQINNLKLNKISFKNDTDKILFTQEIELSAAGYATKNANKLMFVLNAFNLNNTTPKRYRKRENAFKINRGYYDYDEITINLPSEFTIEALPLNFELISKFGEYKTEIIRNSDKSLIYKRTLFIKEGKYENTEYESYRLFREQIAKNDNAKTILTQKI